MQVVNPYYAHQSSVDYVFDVATWVPRRWHSPGWLVLCLLGVALATTAIVLVFPQVLALVDQAALNSSLESLQETIEKGQKEHPWRILSGAAVAAGLAYLFLAVCVADLLLLSEPVYFRVGPGGMVLRVPNGLDLFRPWYKLLDLELAWSDIADWRIVQHKQFGSLSPNAGNTYALLHLRRRDGKRHCIALNRFREPARVIFARIQDSIEMVPMDFEQPTESRELCHEGDA